jgi:hypothetical protein
MFTPSTSGFKSVKLSLDLTGKQEYKTLKEMDVETMEDVYQFLLIISQHNTLHEIRVSGTTYGREKLYSLISTSTGWKNKFKSQQFTPAPGLKYLIFEVENYHGARIKNGDNIQKGLFNPLAVQNARELYVLLCQMSLQARDSLKITF